MNSDKINLMVTNSEKINNACGIFEMNISKKSNALNLTLKNHSIDINKVNYCRKIITSKASIFSNFRGNNLLTTAVNLSLEENPKESFNEIMDIYNKLRDYFFTTQFLVLAAQIIYNSRFIIDTDIAINNTKLAYELMKKNHWFLTSSDDITSAAMISTTSNNLESTFNDIEKCYNILKEENLGVRNNIQTLSHMLSFSKESIDTRCDNVISLNNALIKHHIPLKGYALPILGVASMITKDYDVLAKNIYTADEHLKKQPGFGTFSLGYTMRSMISAALTCSDYIENSNISINDTLTAILNNISLNVVMLMEMAAASASVSAAIAATNPSN